MSMIVKFVVYYGPGSVQIGETGVDLSEFQCEELVLSCFSVGSWNCHREKQ
jgi:hypothetical protein